MKKMFLLLIVLLVSLPMFSQGYDNVSVDLIYEWTQVDKLVNGDFEISDNVHDVYVPSFIVTKTVEETGSGYLNKIWVASNSIVNNQMHNVELNGVYVYWYNGYEWIKSFYVDFIIVGESSTIVTYFYTRNPVEISFEFNDIKIK